MDASEQIRRFEEFFDGYRTVILSQINKKQNFLVVDFAELSRFDPELAEDVLNSPDETLKAAEVAIKEMEGPAQFRIRLKNLPSSQKIMIRNIRSNNIGPLLIVEGVVRQKSDVRPQVVSSKFECPSCGNVISVLQIEASFKEPTRCGCGRKGKFVLLSKELVDAQGMVLEESPEHLEGGEQPKRINVFLKEDLVSPISEKRTNPGSKIIVVGQVKEVPVVLRSGSRSTRFDLLVEANNVEVSEETFYEVEITPEEERKIKEISQDPAVYEKLTRSIAPSIYGYEKIKESLVLQLLGGVQKKRTDGIVSRGDMHILLVGDPGCIAGDSRVALHYDGMRQIKELGKHHLQQIKEVVSKIRKNSKDKPYDFATRFHIYSKQPVLKVMTETGKQVIGTYNQPFLTKDGWKRADELELGEKIRVMPSLPNLVKKLRRTGFTKLERSCGRLKDNIKIPEFFTPELAALCGHVIGDGNIHPRGHSVACYINSEETDLIEKLSSLWLTTFNVSPRIFETKSNYERFVRSGDGLLRQIFSTKPLNILEVNSRQVAANLSFLKEKAVPQAIFESPKQVIAEFVGWLFEADGCVFSNCRGRTAVQLKSRSLKLLQGVQLLLLYFGIQSRIICDNLCIRRTRDIMLFAKHISFRSEKKVRKMSEALNYLQKRKAHLRRGLQRYEKVSAIEPAGVIDVYDFEVPQSRMFVANGIVCHNSGKSQLLKRVSAIAPKGRYVSGKGVSGAGITAAVVKDEFLGGWSLEAGALVLASNGICCTTEDSEFILEDGRRMTFKDLFNGRKESVIHPKFKVLALNRKTMKIEPFGIKQAIRLKNDKKVCVVKTRTGRKLNLTEDNEVLVCKDSNMIWKRIGSLKPGEYIAVPKLNVLPPTNTLNGLNAHLNEEYIAKIAEGDVLWDKIISVEEITASEVYDFTMLGTDNFIANSVIMHNCIDELDKMNADDRGALHEGLEQQTISISKANIQATLLARTTVLAAANPKFGRFDPYGIIAEQIDLPPTLINRFDLIFPIRDLPNEVNDEKMARHILNLHQSPDAGDEEIPTSLLKKYVAYARQRVAPTLTDSALNEIKEFYVQMRNRVTTEEKASRSIPISARQLEALVRLSEASAKVRLSDKVTKKDARRAIELLTYCLLQIGVDRETGRIDIDRIATGISASQRDKIFHIKEIIAELENKLGKTIPIDDVIKQAAEKGLAEGEVEEVIERLKRSGDVYEPRHGFLQRL